MAILDRQKGTRPQPTPYTLAEMDQIVTPAFVVFLELVQANLDEMLRVAGGPARLRPHCKTHKTREIIDLWRTRGVTRHKCATLAEAEMLASCGADDVFIAYQLVGPNVSRLRQLLEAYPRVRFAVAIDSVAALDALATGLESSDSEVGVLLDVDPGMHRTGIGIGPEALELYEAIASTPHVRAEGLHWYDGHLRQPDRHERTAACLAGWQTLQNFRDQLLLAGLPVPRIVAGGTGTFPILATIDEPGLELSPGTTVYHDQSYRELFPEMNFTPAAVILTRVVSANRRGFVTLDVGHKSCDADQPAGKRLYFPDLPDAIERQHTEEHLVLETGADRPFELGDVLVAIPRHVCPASVMYDAALVASGGRLVGAWPIAARNRRLSI
jgi:D-serine deaminase-like pyridoxal phosphate-dependent protein